MRNKILSVLIVCDDSDMLDILALSLALDPAMKLTPFSSLESVRHASLKPKDYDVILVAAELTDSPSFSTFRSLFLANSAHKVTSLILIKSGHKAYDQVKISMISEFDAMIYSPFDPLGIAASVRNTYEKVTVSR